MKVVADDMWFCEDCYVYAVNGDEPAEAGDWTPDDVDAMGPHLVPEGPHVDEDEGADHNEFSRSPCEACGSNLGGSRHRMAQLGEEDEAVGQ